MTRQVRLVSWNLHDLPWFLGPRHSRRMRRVTVDVLALRPEIVAFQEVWVRRDERAMAQSFRSAGYESFESPGALGLTSSGLLTFVDARSGWSIEAQRLERFTAWAPAWKLWEGDGLSQKGFHVVRLRHATAGSLTVINTHLQAQYRNTYSEIRQKQIHQIATAAKEESGAVPLIACGDFNTDPSDPLYELISQPPWVDLTATYRGSGGQQTYFTRFTRRDAMEGWIDYIVARRDRRLRFTADVRLLRNVRRDDPYSDHQGLLATVTIEDRQ